MSAAPKSASQTSSAALHAALERGSYRWRLSVLRSLQRLACTDASLDTMESAARAVLRLWGLIPPPE